LLEHTFSHIPGIGLKTERKLWAAGVSSWDDFLATRAGYFSSERWIDIKACLEQSRRSLIEGDPGFFSGLLPPSEQWRLFNAFRDKAAYLDIETYSLNPNINPITTIALYDGRDVFHYIQGRNLEDFADDIGRYQLLITYNGKAFDVPILEKQFRIRLNQAHIDLRYVLRSLGYTGGLKGCERRLGLDRGELDGVDGYYAVLLWHEYQNNADEKALNTLLAYNVEDVLNLEPLMVMAYNMKLKEAPFDKGPDLAAPLPPRNPFQPDIQTLRKIRNFISNQRQHAYFRR